MACLRKPPRSTSTIVSCNQPTVHEELFPFSVRPHGESSFHAILSEKYYEPSIMLDNRPELYMEVLHFLTFHKRLFNLHIIAMTFTYESTNEFLLIFMRNFVSCFIRMLHIYPTGAVCCLHFPPGVAVDSIRATEAFTVWRVIKTNHCNNYDKLISRGLKALFMCLFNPFRESVHNCCLISSTIRVRQTAFPRSAFTHFHQKSLFN